MHISKQTLGMLFHAIGDKLMSGDCEITQDACDSIFETLQESVRTPMSKAQACRYLNISRSTFDARVASGQLPHGKKIQGFTGLVWYKNELK